MGYLLLQCWHWNIVNRILLTGVWHWNVVNETLLLECFHWNILNGIFVIGMFIIGPLALERLPQGDSLLEYLILEYW